jgi:hypothetical protein
MLVEARTMYTIPEQYYDKTIDWVIDSYNHGNFNPNHYQIIYPKETIYLPPPKGLDPVRWSTTCHFDEAFVAMIPNGRVVTGNCYVVTPNNKRLRDVEYYYPYSFRHLPTPEYRAETVATLVWGWNIPELVYTQAIYGHWFFDILPRIHLVEQSGIHIDKFLIGKLTHPFQYESLNMLGLPLEKFFQVDRNDFHLITDQLVVPSVPWILGKSPRWAFQFIHKRLKEDHSIPKNPGNERIYISRQDALARYVVNEKEVMNYLRQKGFTRIVTTPLSTFEKVSLFSSAEVIVTPFGSNNANLAFCNPGTKVIEMSPVTVIDDYFWKISNYAQLDYYEMICDIELPPKSVGGADNLIVDINKLAQILALAGI